MKKRYVFPQRYCDLAELESILQKVEEIINRSTCVEDVKLQFRSISDRPTMDDPLPGQGLFVLRFAADAAPDDLLSS